MKEISQEMLLETDQIFDDLEVVFQSYLLDKKEENHIEPFLNIIERLGKLDCLNGLEKSSRLASTMNEILLKIKEGKIKSDKDTIDMLIFCSYFLRNIIKNERNGKTYDSKYEFFIQELQKIIQSGNLPEDKSGKAIRAFKSEPSQISRILAEQHIQINWKQVNNLMNLTDDLLRLQSSFESQMNEITKENPYHPDVLPLSEMTVILEKIVCLIQEKVMQVQSSLAEIEIEKYSSTINELSKEYIIETAIEEEQETTSPDQKLWGQISDIIENISPDNKFNESSPLWDILENYGTMFDDIPDFLNTPGIECPFDSFEKGNPMDDIDKTDLEEIPDRTKILTSFEEPTNVEHDEDYLMKAIQELNLAELSYFEEMLVTDEGQVYIILNRAAFF